MKVLVVHHTFTLAQAAAEGAEPSDPVTFEKGQMIRDPAAIEAVESAGQRHHCTQTDVDEAFFAADDAPAADEAPAAPAKSKAAAKATA